MESRLREVAGLGDELLKPTPGRPRPGLAGLPPRDGLGKSSTGDSPSSIISGCMDSESDLDSSRSFQHMVAAEEEEDVDRYADERAVNSVAARSVGSGTSGSFAERLAARRFDPLASGSLRASTARFKTVPPSRLQSITRACVTIPPGLSPTTLLDSPVLLPTSQAEPSPTTGTYPLPPFLDGIFTGGSRPPPPHVADPSKERDQGSSALLHFKALLKPVPRNSPLAGPLRLPPTSSQEPSFALHQQQQQQQQQPIDAIAQASGAALPPTPAPVGEEAQSAEAVPSSTLGGEQSNSALPLQASPPMDTQGKPLELETQVAEPELQGGAPQSSITTIVPGPSEDGYNWRKYGQKQVKGSEYPRSYYKCTHPNCPMKKKVERSHDGQVTEIIYKGDHNHQRPLPTRRLSVSAGAVHVIGEADKADGSEAWGGFQTGASSDVLGKHERHSDGGRNSIFGTGVVGTPEPSSSSTSDGDDDEDGESKDYTDEEREAKRRKKERRAREAAAQIAAPLPRINREPRVVVQTTSEVDILDDGYRWRKYGQKVVKGNPHPRSYYKCTNLGCPVRKHVERASNDPKSVITTYEGKHNHDVPAARNSGGCHEPAVIGGQSSSSQSSSMNTMSAAATSLQDQGSRFPTRRPPGGMDLRNRDHGGNGYLLTSISMSLSRHNSEGGAPLGRPPLNIDSLAGRVDFTRPKQEQSEEYSSDNVNSQQQRIPAGSASYHQNMQSRVALGP